MLAYQINFFRIHGTSDCPDPTQWLLSSHALWVCMPQEAALLARGCHPFSATANHPQHTGPCSVRRRRSNYGRPTPSGWYTFLLAPMICPAASSFVLHRNRIRTEALSARLARSAGLRTIIFPSTPLERYYFFTLSSPASSITVRIFRARAWMDLRPTRWSRGPSGLCRSPQSKTAERGR